MKQPQLTVSSLIGTMWTRRSDGQQFTVVGSPGDHPVAVTPNTVLTLSSRSRSRSHPITYAGLVAKYHDDQLRYEEELQEIASGGFLGQDR